MCFPDVTITHSYGWCKTRATERGKGKKREREAVQLDDRKKGRCNNGSENNERIAE